MNFPLPAKRIRRKVKLHTRRQLHRAAVARRKERAAEAKEQRARMYRALRHRRSEQAFKGCDPERTLALLGEDA